MTESKSLFRLVRDLPANFWYANLMEIFERLAFFGVRAIAPLYLVKSASENGLGLSFEDKGNIYGATLGIGYRIRGELTVQFEYVHKEGKYYKDGVAPLCDVLHQGFKNARGIADEKRGLLVLRFDFDTSVWPRPNQGNDIYGPTVPEAVPLLFRCADANGEVLKSFTTNEVFIADGVEVPENMRIAYGDNIMVLRPQGNELAYPMNARDLNFVRWVEIGFKTTRPYKFP